MIEGMSPKEFNEKFRDLRDAGMPRDGEVMARYAGMAVLGDGSLKRQILQMLKTKDGARRSQAILTWVGRTNEAEAIRVLLDIGDDLGVMTEQAVLDKPYRYMVEFFFYADPKDIPCDDPHWSTISLQVVDSPK